jgi:hypothetical protein
VAVLKRQLKLREELRQAGRIDHNQIFFTENGKRFRDIDDPGSRWSLSLAKLPIRHRRPYCARHSSVSWNLMIGKNPLWVARQHGHSTRTMLEVYAAWADGAVESDIEAIKRSMGFSSATMPVSTATGAVAQPDPGTAIDHRRRSRPLFSIWHWIWRQKRGACA